LEAFDVLRVLCGPPLRPEPALSEAEGRFKIFFRICNLKSQSPVPSVPSGSKLFL